MSTVAGSIFSGLKQKVKSVESKLHAAHDGTDGIGSSKLVSQVPDNTEKGITGEKINELDTVERGSYLQDVRQNRAKAPKRRPPTSAGSIIGDTNNNVSMNGSHTESNDSITNETANVTSTSPAQTTQHHEEELAKPKAREWEKHKAPWMEELKANQARKTSPNVEHKSPDHEKNDMSKSFSSSFSSSQKKISTQENFEVRASSMEVKSNSFDVFNKQQKEKTSEVHGTSSINSSVDTSSAKSTTKISITDNSSSVLSSSTTTTLLSSSTPVKVDDQSLNIRPTSVSLRNRSISPVPRTQVNNHIAKPSPSNVSATHITPTSATVLSSSTADIRVNELEQRVIKLETLVTAQNATIEELKKLLREESDKVKTLKNDLEKYAQCFTQV